MSTVKYEKIQNNQKREVEKFIQFF